MAAVAHRHGDSQASGSGSRGGSSHHGATVTRKDTSSSSTKGEKAKVGNWRIGRTIGKGSSGMYPLANVNGITDIQGRVKIAKHAITGKYAAIKIVPKQALVESRMSMSEAGARQDKVLLGIEREIVIMKLIDHPNVLNLYDVWETKTELYAISFSL
jgi:serine/threonine-protein kinase HSL1 (negative regulator of Swe1 kinase)